MRIILLSGKATTVHEALLECTEIMQDMDSRCAKEADFTVSTPENTIEECYGDPNEDILWHLYDHEEDEAGHIISLALDC